MVQPPSMAQTVAQLVGPCLEKICEVASGRKYTKLRHEAKSLLSNLEEALQPVTHDASASKASVPAEPAAAAAELAVREEEQRPVSDAGRASAAGDGEAAADEQGAAGAPAEDAAPARDTGDVQQVLCVVACQCLRETWDLKVVVRRRLMWPSPL